MSQDPHLFRGTIADNVRFADPEASRADVEAALGRAAAAFAFELPDGIDTRIGERGTRLSAGERARLALARALVRHPRLLLLDEPTAHLDGVSEHAVLDGLSRLAGSTTILMAAHRPAAARRADRLIRVESGRVDVVAR
jgi:ABC-type multidrug transport system fused ATPase/permease subunit